MTKIQEYADRVLKDHDCDCYTYGDKDKPWCQLNTIIGEFKEAYPDGMEYAYEDVAQAIFDISKPRYLKPEAGPDLFDFGDWGKWGVGDFYEEIEKKLRDVIRSGKTFDTGWHGYRKEIESFRVQRTNEEVIVSCSSAIDEVFEQSDLFSDFLTEEEMEMLTDEKMDEIRDCLLFDCFSGEAVCTESLPVDADFDAIMASAGNLIHECHAQDNEHFRYAIATTLQVLYGDSEDTLNKIAERFNECGGPE